MDCAVISYSRRPGLVISAPQSVAESRTDAIQRESTTHTDELISLGSILVAHTRNLIHKIRHTHVSSNIETMEPLSVIEYRHEIHFHYHLAPNIWAINRFRVSLR